MERAVRVEPARPLPYRGRAALEAAQADFRIRQRQKTSGRFRKDLAIPPRSKNAPTSGRIPALREGLPLS